MKLVIGISGATGVVYGIRLLDVLKDLGVETHLVITDMGKATISLETTHCMSKVERLATQVYGIRDLAAGISSGSFARPKKPELPARSLRCASHRRRPINLEPGWA